MIKSIILKDVATYDSVNGVQLNDLKKLNFFFGFNGSGKSTIAKYLYNFGLLESDKSTNFDSCSQNGYDFSNEQILVFDENFTERNFKKTSYIKGVFSLNQKNVAIDIKIKEQEHIINSYSEIIEKKRSYLAFYEEKKEKSKQDLIEFCWSQREFFSPFVKISLPNSRNKVNHFTKIEEILKGAYDSMLTIEMLSDEYRRLYEKELSKVEFLIDCELYKQIRYKERELNTLLQEVIVGNENVDVSALIKTLKSRNWVEIGVEFLKQTNDVCPFCQEKTITSNLKKQFETFFDEAYKKKIEQLTNLIDLYKKLFQRFDENILKVQESYNEGNITSNLYVKIRKIFDSNVSVLEDKLRNPNEKKIIISLSTLQKELSSLIKKINEKNKTFSELGEKRILLEENIWNFMATKCKDEMITYINKEKRYDSLNFIIKEVIIKYEIEVRNSRKNIEDLRTQTVNTKDAVDNINLRLKNSGFDSFEICELEVLNNISKYYLKRSNSSESETKNIFGTLSEGEKSFISFLYFYQLCIGTDDIQNNGNKKKIIIIDDPVSSLDSQVLFIVSSLIRGLISKKNGDKNSFKNLDIAQVFILTHNLYFYKEVSFERRLICKDHRYYRIIKIDNITTIIGEDKKPIFDDYSMLWQTIRKIKENLPQDSSFNILISNTMRRIIESYVNFIGLGEESWSSISDLDQGDFDYSFKSAFIAEINDESHGINAFDSVYYQKLSNEKPEILFNFFKDIFKGIGKEHYTMMMNETFDD